MSTSWCGCKSCHHEYYGDTSTKCSWCGGETKILQSFKPMNAQKVADNLSKIAKDRERRRQENAKRN